MRKTILFLTIIAYAFLINAQEMKFATSKNSKFFATLQKTSKQAENTYQLNLYNVLTQKWQRNLILTLSSGFVPEKIKINSSGLVCAIISGNKAQVWSLISGKKINTGNINNCFFPNKADVFVCSYANWAIIFNAVTAQKLKTIQGPNKQLIKEVHFSKNDRYILTKTFNNIVSVYSPFGKKIENINCADFLFTKNNNEIIMLERNGNNYDVSLYNLYSFDKTGQFDVMGFVAGINSQKQKKLKALGIKNFEPYVLIPKKCKLSKDEKSVILYFTKTNQNGSTQNDIMIVDMEKKQKTNTISDRFYKDNIQFDQYAEHQATALILPIGKTGAAIYDIEEKEILSSLYFAFSDEDIIKKIPENQQSAYLTTSPDYKYSVLETSEGKKTDIYIKSTSVEQASVKLKGTKFLCFDQQSKYVFLWQKNGEPAYVKTSDVSASIDGGIEIHTFENMVLPATPENEIIEEKEPPGYHYTKITGFKHISELPPKSIIKLHFKTMSLGRLRSGLQCHLIDTSGIYYYGASEKEWRHIWKKLAVQFTGDKSVKIVEDFTVAETKPEYNYPNVVALVLDHSGSMGEKRALAIQKAAIGFVGKKQAKDKFAVIKYDHKIGNDTEFTKDKDKLIKQIETIGLEGYGGATSLLDAVAYGADVLNNNTEKANKSVVILTDGGENSSQIKKGDLLKFANFSDVKIHTLGFGSFVDDDYLKALAYYTQGSYYHIYKTSNFDWIFDDIYKKLNHYYTIKFKTDKIGEYKAVLEIAIDDLRKDTLSATFTTVPIDYEELNKEKSSTSFKPPIVEIVPIADDIEEIYELGEMQEEEEELLYVQQIKKIKKEFEKIEFPKIKFVSNGTVIVKGTETGIDNTIAFMKKYPKINIEITGHTDNIGDAEKNMQLSKQRAESVKQYMKEKGIAAGRIKTKGMGAEKPIADNGSEKGRLKNRRVEFNVLKRTK